MKKIINGKKYDTETSTRCGGYKYGLVGDFNHEEETLYRKKNGEFFLHGEGGACTKYAKCCEPNSFTGGENIIPMTEEDAKKWGETYLNYDEYVGIFGEPEE